MHARNYLLIILLSQVFALAANSSQHVVDFPFWNAVVEIWQKCHRFSWRVKYLSQKFDFDNYLCYSYCVSLSSTKYIAADILNMHHNLGSSHSRLEMLLSLFWSNCLEQKSCRCSLELHWYLPVGCSPCSFSAACHPRTLWSACRPWHLCTFRSIWSELHSWSNWWRSFHSTPQPACSTICWAMLDRQHLPGQSHPRAVGQCIWIHFHLELRHVQLV